MHSGLKRLLFGLAGPGWYSRLHALRFRRDLARALASPARAQAFFGSDVLAFADHLGA